MNRKLSGLGVVAVLIGVVVAGCANQGKENAAAESATYAAAAQREEYRAPACYPANDMCLNGGDCCSGKCDLEKCL